VWREVKIDAAGDYVLTFHYAAEDDRAFDLSIDGGEGVRIAAPAKDGAIATVATRVTLGRGVHTVRLSNATAWMPDIDRMTVVPASADSASCGK
jgi:hypothetical protein